MKPGNNVMVGSRANDMCGNHRALFIDEQDRCFFCVERFSFPGRLDKISIEIGYKNPNTNQ